MNEQIYLIQERMGGSDNGSGTTAAARGIEAALRENGEEEEQSGADAADRANDANKTVGNIPPVTANTEETVSFARSEAALCSRKDEHFTSHDDVTVGEAKATATATALTSESSTAQTGLYGDDVGASRVVAGVAAPRTCDGGGEARRSSSHSKISDSEPGSTASGPQTSPHLASTKVQDENGTKDRGSTERKKDVEGPQGEEELSGRRSGPASKTGAGAEEKDAGVAQLLGRDASRSVDCLMHIKW